MRSCPAWRRALTALTILGSMAATAAAEPLTVTSAELRVTCPMTVGGSFVAKSTALTGEVERTSSGIVATFRVDLTTIETGIGLRDRHLREKYLEVAREGFATATLTDITLDPATAADGGEASFTGQLTLHGVTRPVTGSATVTDGTRVEATFPISIPEHGIKKPRHLGVGVKDEIEAHVSMVLAAGGMATR